MLFFWGGCCRRRCHATVFAYYLYSGTGWGDRDLHAGNILIHTSQHKHIEMVAPGVRISVPTGGFEARIIDFTLSRLDKSRINCVNHTYEMNKSQDEELVAFYNLESDPELFIGEGNFQFDVYREMRQVVKNDWKQVMFLFEIFLFVLSKFCF